MLLLIPRVFLLYCKALPNEVTVIKATFDKPGKCMLFRARYIFEVLHGLVPY